MAKALKIAALVASVAAIAVVTGGAGLGLGLSLTTTAFGVSAGTLLAASAVLGTGASLLAPKPKAPGGLTSTSDRLTVSINTREPRKIVFGSTAMATDLRDQEYSSDQTFVHRFIVLASHKIHAVRAIYFDDKLAWTAAGGAQGEFRQWLQVTPVLEGSAANAINLGPRMGASRRYTGCAYLYLRYQILANSKKLDSVFNQSIPSRVTIVGDGASVYDPRRDSTVPGGSGPQRADDQSTWAWDDSASRNPALATLFYLLGWRINGRLAVGKGIPAKRLDLASFIEAANLCDEPVARSAGGTEPRYRCDGVISEGDSTEAVLDNLKATMNGVIDDVDGRLRVTVLHNDLAAPIGDLFSGDVLGNFTWQQTLPLNDSVSVIRGGYVDASTSSLYQLVDYPEISIASRDGIERSQTVNYPLVQSASQAQRLSKQRLQRMIYGGTFTAVFQSTAWKFQKGDVIRFSFRPLGWDRKLFRIADIATQVDGKVPMMLREEHSAIYAWDASDAVPVTAAEPTKYDPALWPLVQGVTEAGTTAEWDKVADPNNTKPQDNATVGAPNGTNIGDQPVEDVLAEIAAAKKRREEIDAELVVIDGVVKDAGERITAAQARADAAFESADTVNSRVDQLIAEGGGGSDGVDTVARAEIQRVEQVAIKGDEVVAKSVDAVSARLDLVPTSFLAVAVGAIGNPKGGPGAGLYAADGTRLVAPRRGFTVVTFNGSNVPETVKTFDTYGGAVEGAALYDGDAQAMGNYLNAISDGAGVVIFSYDEPQAGHDLPFLISAMWRCGAGALFTDSGFYYGSAYVLIGRAGIGRGNGVERYAGSTPYSPDSYLQQPFTLLGGVPQISPVGRLIDARAETVERSFAAADQALASRAQLLEANMRTAPQYLNRQATFSDWPDERAVPTLMVPGGWGLASQTAGSTARVPGVIGRYALEAYWPGGSGNLFHAVSGRDFGDVGGGIDAGMLANAGWYVIEVDVTLVEGTLAGAGCYLASYAADGTGLGNQSWLFPDNPDATGVAPGNGTPGKRYRFAFVWEFTDTRQASLRFHPMTAWTDFGAASLKRLRWNLAGVRQATAEEIANRKARTVDLPAAVARIKSSEDTLADLPNRYAAAQRVASLEAKIDGGQPSNLTNIIGATIEDRATAIADAKAGAVAQTVSQLRSEYNQARGELTVTSSVASDAYGRSRSFLQQRAVAGNNRAQLTLYSDSNGGAGVDIVGDVSIAGDLVVDGTVYTSKIANGAVTNSVGNEGAGTSWTASQTGGGNARNVAQLGLTCSGGPVRIDVAFGTNTVDIEGGGTGQRNQFILQIVRSINGAEQVIKAVQFVENSLLTWWIFDSPGAGGVSYFVRVIPNVLYRSANINGPRMFVTEFKR